jgi:hypothetical protein
VGEITLLKVSDENSDEVDGNRDALIELPLVVRLAVDLGGDGLLVDEDGGHESLERGRDGQGGSVGRLDTRSVHAGQERARVDGLALSEDVRVGLADGLLRGEPLDSRSGRRSGILNLDVDGGVGGKTGGEADDESLAELGLLASDPPLGGGDNASDVLGASNDLGRPSN